MTLSWTKWTWLTCTSQITHTHYAHSKCKGQLNAQLLNTKVGMACITIITHTYTSTYACGKYKRSNANYLTPKWAWLTRSTRWWKPDSAFYTTENCSLGASPSSGGGRGMCATSTVKTGWMHLEAESTSTPCIHASASTWRSSCLVYTRQTMCLDSCRPVVYKTAKLDVCSKSESPPPQSTCSLLPPSCNLSSFLPCSNYPSSPYSPSLSYLTHQQVNEAFKLHPSHIN